MKTSVGRDSKSGSRETSRTGTASTRSRFVSIHLPNLEVDLAVRRDRSGRARNAAAVQPPERPAVIVFQERNGVRRVRDCCLRSREAGVIPGMGVAEAMDTAQRFELVDQERAFYQSIA